MVDSSRGACLSGENRRCDAVIKERGSEYKCLVGAAQFCRISALFLRSMRREWERKSLLFTGENDNVWGEYAMHISRIFV